MRTKILFLFLGIILYSSCQEDKLDFDTSVLLEDSPLARSITPQVSKVFDWEDTTKVMLIGHGLVTLPWYSGASTSIPDYILKDYEAADGWTMLYNFCSDPISAQVGAYYLMFYNYFTGIYRVFFYNINNTTTAGMTIWRVSFDNECAFFDTQGEYTLPLNSPKIIPETYISNISSLPAKSLTRGWNCFDFELLYDPDVANKSLRMNIGVYDMRIDSVEMNGSLNLDSEGVIITETETNPLSSIINGAANIAGKAAGEYIQNEIGQRESRGGGIIAAGVSALVKAGVNFLGKSFLGRNSKTNITTQDLRIRTKGKIKIEGQITSNQQSNILPIANIKMPGAQSLVADSYLPAFDEPLGVWNLSDNPVAEISDIKSISMFVGGRFDNEFNATLRVQRNIYFDLENVKKVLKINPIILPMLEKYEVTAELCTNIPYADVPIFYIGIPMFADSNERLIKGVSSWGFDYSQPRNSLIVRTLQTQGVLESQVTDLNPLMACYVKVTVTLFPKAPYDTREIYSTKTFRIKPSLRKEFVK